MAVLSTLLRLVLALVLGLGPLGASVLAASLHAPLCACSGCGADANGAASCCAGEEPARDAPLVVSAESSCPCAWVLPGRQGGTEATACVRPARSAAEVALERGQRVSKLLVSATHEPPERFAREAPPDGREDGPQGRHAARGSQRAAAFGALRL
jgi:hypothetical protein